MKKLVMALILFLSIPLVKAQELPKLYFEGNIEKMETKKDIRTIKIKYVSAQENFEGFAEIKIQGKTSISFEKKNYTIKFYEDENLENKLKIDFGWGKQNKYCLKANWIDKTHARNIVTARLASASQAQYDLLNDTPNHGLIDGFPIEIYSNGEFLGLYTLNIPKDAWMFNMDEDNPNNIVVMGDKWTNSIYFIEEATWDGTWELEVGEENDETLTKLNHLIKFVKDSTDEEFKEHINEYLNLDALINYYVISEYLYLPDNFGLNLILLTYDGKVWYPSLYDLDTSLGTNHDGDKIYTPDHILADGFDSRLFIKLLKNFPTEIADHYFKLKKKVLNPDNVMKEVNNFINSIPSEVYQKEQERWHDIPGFDENQMAEFITKRTPIIDEYMENLYPDYIKTWHKVKPYVIGEVIILSSISAIIITIVSKRKTKKNKKITK